MSAKNTKALDATLIVPPTITTEQALASAERTPAEHETLIAQLQDEFLADDLIPPAHSISWTVARLHAWFEAGGVEDHASSTENKHVDSTALPAGEHDVNIPTKDGVLKGKLTWPGGEHVDIGVLWCAGNPTANPHFDYWGENMHSPLLSAIQTSLASGEHTNQQQYAFLRFDYSTCLTERTARGGFSDLSFPPMGHEEAGAALAFLRTRCTKIAVGGHNVGASNAAEAAAHHSEALVAFVSINHAPDVYKYLPPAFQKYPNGETVKAAMERGVASLPKGVPKLFLAASGDPVTPASSLKRYVDMTPEPAKSEILKETPFTLAGKESEIARDVVRFIYEAVVTWVVGGRV